MFNKNIKPVTNISPPYVGFFDPAFLKADA